jgi:hypothetical protein
LTQWLALLRHKHIHGHSQTVTRCIFTTHAGAKDATAHCHVDAYHNFYYQIYGHKRFLLFSPKEHANLYLYPENHSFARRSQVNFSAPDLNLFPRFQNAEAWEVRAVASLQFHMLHLILVMIVISIQKKKNG